MPVFKEFGFYEAESVAAKKGVIEKLGDFIKEVFEKINKFFSDLIDKIKNMGFKNKTVLEKYEIFKKAHPDQAEQLKVYLDEGKIDTGAMMNSIKDLEKAYDEISAAAIRDGADVPVLKRKWEQAKKKFNDSETTWKTAGTIIGSIAAAVGLLLTFGKISEVVSKNRDKANAERTFLENRNRQLMGSDKDDDVKKVSPDVKAANNDDSVSASRLRAVMALDYAKTTGKAYTSVTWYANALKAAILKLISSKNPSQATKDKNTKDKEAYKDDIERRAEALKDMRKELGKSGGGSK
jgi:hypothetical protein